MREATVEANRERTVRALKIILTVLEWRKLCGKNERQQNTMPARKTRTEYQDRDATINDLYYCQFSRGDETPGHWVIEIVTHLPFQF
jgi:hypothetical protein